MKKKSKLFITGITGAVGSYFADYLINSEYEVYALLTKPDRLALEAREASNFHILNGYLEDIMDFKSILEDCEYIIHLAANWVDPNLPDCSMNNQQTQVLFSLANPKKIKRILYFSTASIIGRDNCLLPEARKYGSGYITSKYDAYLALQESLIKDKIVIIFPTMVISGDKKHRYSHIGEGLFDAKKYLKWVRFLSINGTFHFIHADDIARMSMHLLKQESCKPEYVFGNKQQKIDDSINEIAKFFGYKNWFKIPIPTNFIIYLAELLRFKIDPYGKFCLQYKHFTYDTVNSESFGLESNYDSWTKIMDSIEKAKNEP